MSVTITARFSVCGNNYEDLVEATEERISTFFEVNISDVKKKFNYEEILRKRADDLRDLFKSKTNAWETVEKKNIIRTKLMNIRDQSEKRGYDDLTRNVSNLLKRVDVYTGKIKTNKNGNPVSIFNYNSKKVNLNLGKRTRKHANVSL